MSDNKATRVGERPVANQSAVLAWLLPITVNIALPITTLFLLSGPVGLPDVPALLISGIWPVLEIGYTVRTQRHVDEFSIFVLLGLVVGVVTTLFSGSAQAYFLKDSLATGLIGIAFLLSLLVGRPLTFYLGRRFATNGSKAQRDWWDGLWVHPDFRRVQRRLGAAWGTALLGEGVVRALLTRQLGTASMVLVNNTVPYAVIAIMIAVSITVGNRARARARQHGSTTAEAPSAPSAPSTEAR